MTNDKFEKIFNDTLTALKALLDVKTPEYTTEDGDRFENFHKGKNMIFALTEMPMTTLDVLFAYMSKHLASVNQIVSSGEGSAEKINEKINDIIMYWIIAKAMLLEKNEALDFIKATDCTKERWTETVSAGVTNVVRTEQT